MYVEHAILFLGESCIIKDVGVMVCTCAWGVWWVLLWVHGSGVMPAQVCLMHPFDVTGDGRRNLWTIALLRYWKLGKKPKFMAQNKVCVSAKKSTWCVDLAQFWT